MINFIIYSLAIWRITSLLTGEDGPLDIFHHLRRKLKGLKALDCFWCASVWISLPFAISLSGGLNIIIYTLALSTSSIIINELI